MLPKTVEQLPHQTTGVPEFRVALLAQRAGRLLLTPLRLTEDEERTVEATDPKVLVQEASCPTVAEGEVGEESERPIAFADVEQAAQLRLPGIDCFLCARFNRRLVIALLGLIEDALQPFRTAGIISKHVIWQIGSIVATELSEGAVRHHQS